MVVVNAMWCQISGGSVSHMVSHIPPLISPPSRSAQRPNLPRDARQVVGILGKSLTEHFGWNFGWKQWPNNISIRNQTKPRPKPKATSLLPLPQSSQRHQDHSEFLGKHRQCRTLQLFTRSFSLPRSRRRSGGVKRRGSGRLPRQHARPRGRLPPRAGAAAAATATATAMRAPRRARCARRQPRHPPRPRRRSHPQRGSG